MSKLYQYAERIHQTAKDKGFWDSGKDRNRDEMVMLIISELGECLEAHRKGKICSLPDNMDKLIAHWMDTQSDEDAFVRSFESRVKDTVEDEIADTIIRVLDYMKGWEQPCVIRECRVKSTQNFGSDLLEIVRLILYARQQEKSRLPIVDWGYVLAHLEAFCNWWEIDIDRHIRWKMRYNSGRIKLHGKKY